MDPILRWTERPWQDTVNRLWPLIYWMQWAANMLGGDNMHDVVFFLQLSVACSSSVPAPRDLHRPRQS